DELQELDSDRKLRAWVSLHQELGVHCRRFGAARRGDERRRGQCAKCPGGGVLFRRAVGGKQGGLINQGGSEPVYEVPIHDSTRSALGAMRQSRACSQVGSPCRVLYR